MASKRRLSSKRLSMAPSVGKGASRSRVSDAGMTPQMVQSMYAKVFKLSVENKITTKNTWSLPLIDHMERLCAGDGQNLNFRQAATTLDASVMIYSSRVDDVWTTSFRVLENLNRSDKKAREAKRAEGDDSDDEEGGKKKRKAKKKAQTIEKNLSNITLKNFDMAWDVDPLFHKMSKAFDEGGAKGMLLGNLGVQTGCRLAFDSVDVADANDVTLTEEDVPDAVGDVDCSALQSKLNTFLSAGTDLESLRLCPQLEGLYSVLEEGSGCDTSTIGSHSVTGPAGEESAYGNSIMSNASTVAGGAGAPAAGLSAAVDTSGPMFNEAELFGGPEFDPVMDSDSDDDAGGFDEAPSFADPAIMRLMEEAGHTSFAHWRPRDPAEKPKISRVSKKGRRTSFEDAESVEEKKSSRKTKKSTKKTTKKGKGKDDDDEEEEEEGEFFIDFSCACPDDKAFAPPPRSATATQLTTAALRKAAGDGRSQYVLAPEVQLAQSELPEGAAMWGIGTAPASTEASDGAQGNILTGLQADDDSSDDDEPLGGYEQDFENDHYIPPELPAHSNALDRTAAFTEGPTVFEDDFEMTGMVQAARTVGKIGVKFARVAKQVDVKKLKSDIWGFLEGQSHNEDVADEENPTLKSKSQRAEPEAEAEADTESEANPEEQITFQQAISSLAPHQSQDVSVPFYFICLLHLANEQCLKLETPEEETSGTDFRICLPKTPVVSAESV